MRTHLGHSLSVRCSGISIPQIGQFLVSMFPLLLSYSRAHAPNPYTGDKDWGPLIEQESSQETDASKLSLWLAVPLSHLESQGDRPGV